MKRARGGSKNHEHVYRALCEGQKPMSAYQVLDSVRVHGISAPLSVYRALDYLVDRGQVHRLESMNAYVACSEGEHVHAPAVFAICTDCNGIEELDGTDVLAKIAVQADRAGFRTATVTVEIKGVCATCSAGAETADERDPDAVDADDGVDGRVS